MGRLKSPPILDVTGRRIARALEHIGHLSAPVFGFEIDESGSLPDQMVRYIDDAIGVDPFAMDLSTGIPNYGGWGDAFFMPRPCLLKYDGTVHSYLDPNDLSLTSDGEASLVEDTSFDGNAMMEWPIIWTSITRDGDKIQVRFSTERIDSTFHAYANTARNGNITNFYTPIYNGSEVDGKLRSMSNQTIMQSKTAAQEIALAEACGDGWTIEKFADRMLINNLCFLISKSLDSQGAFGQGYISGGSADNFVKTGTMNDKGLFYGTSSSAQPEKLFGMENYYGQQWRRLVGWLMATGVQKIKCTWGTEDGSAVTGFNLTGNGYVPLQGSTPSGSSGSYISRVLATRYGLLPLVASGSSTTKYCDGLWFNNDASTICAFVGGASHRGAVCGVSCADLGSSPSIASWNVGASPSYTKAS